MNIQYIPATVAFVHDMCDCGLRAFENDGLDHALFPRHLRDPRNDDGIYEFRVERMRKRLQNPGWRYLVATTDSGDGHAQVVGYAGWSVPLRGNDPGHEQDENLVGNQVEQEAQRDDSEIYPQGMDVEAYKHVMEIIDNTKKEILGGAEHKVWYLASLAVDPEFKGRNIASNLVKWGLDKADEDQVPAYLESTPVAVGLYERLGFRVLKKLSVVKDNENHFLTVMIRTPNVIAEISKG